MARDGKGGKNAYYVDDLYYVKGRMEVDRKVQRQVQEQRQEQRQRLCHGV